MKQLLIPNLRVFGVFQFGLLHRGIGIVLLTLALAAVVYVIYHLGILARGFLEAIV